MRRRSDSDDIEKKLDEVVGKRFDEERYGTASARWRRRLLKWALGVAFAAAAAAIVFVVLDRHLKAAHDKPGTVKEPVPVRIIPAK